MSTGNFIYDYDITTLWNDRPVKSVDGLTPSADDGKVPVYNSVKDRFIMGSGGGGGITSIGSFQPPGPNQSGIINGGTGPNALLAIISGTPATTTTAGIGVVATPNTSAPEIVTISIIPPTAPTLGDIRPTTTNRWIYDGNVTTPLAGHFGYDGTRFYFHKEDVSGRDATFNFQYLNSMLNASIPVEFLSLDHVGGTMSPSGASVNTTGDVNDFAGSTTITLTIGEEYTFDQQLVKPQKVVLVDGNNVGSTLVIGTTSDEDLSIIRNNFERILLTSTDVSVGTSSVINTNLIGVNCSVNATSSIDIISSLAGAGFNVTTSDVIARYPQTGDFKIVQGGGGDPIGIKVDATTTLLNSVNIKAPNITPAVAPTHVLAIDTSDGSIKSTDIASLQTGFVIDGGNPKTYNDPVRIGTIGWPNDGANQKVLEFISGADPIMRFRKVHLDPFVQYNVVEEIPNGVGTYYFGCEQPQLVGYDGTNIVLGGGVVTQDATKRSGFIRFSAEPNYTNISTATDFNLMGKISFAVGNLNGREFTFDPLREVVLTITNGPQAQPYEDVCGQDNDIPNIKWIKNNFPDINGVVLRGTGNVLPMTISGSALTPGDSIQINVDANELLLNDTEAKLTGYSVKLQSQNVLLPAITQATKSNILYWDSVDGKVYYDAPGAVSGFVKNDTTNPEPLVFGTSNNEIFNLTNGDGSLSAGPNAIGMSFGNGGDQMFVRNGDIEIRSTLVKLPLIPESTPPTVKVVYFDTSSYGLSYGDLPSRSMYQGYFTGLGSVVTSVDSVITAITSADFINVVNTDFSSPPGSNNKITYTGTTTKYFRINYDVYFYTGSADKSVLFTIYKNDDNAINPTVGYNQHSNVDSQFNGRLNEYVSLSKTFLMQLAPNDYIRAFLYLSGPVASSVIVASLNVVITEA